MAKELKDMTTYELLEKVWYAAIETTKAGGKQIGPSCTFFDVHSHIDRRIDEAKARGDRLEAEVWAAREVGVAMKNIIKENQDKLHVDMSLALRLDKATDMWEKSALAVNAAGDLKEVENA